MLGALILFTLLPNLSRLSAQTSECGTPDFPLAQMQQILANLPNDPLVAGGSPFRIPIWFFHIRNGNGGTNHPGYEFESQLVELNQYFDGVFEFTICGSNVINSYEYYDLDLVNEAPALHGMVNASYQPVINHCVKVFLVHGIINGIETPNGYAHERFQFNENAAVYFGNADTKTLAHELGHYFGLPHTFAQPNQYVNSPVFINGVKYTCHQTGDGFCDTPAEIEYIACPPNITISDPEGVTYTPDPSLLMGSSVCRNRFSNEQIVRMITFYNSHPNYDALQNVPNECAVKSGIILHHCVSGSDPFPDPISDLYVDIKASGQSCFDVTNDAGYYDIAPTTPASCNIGTGKRSIAPDLNWGDPLNGVTTLDLVLISKHILGLEILDSPFKIIAADANNSGSVTTFDIPAIRKVILGIEPNFPSQLSWRYVPNLFLGYSTFASQFYTLNPFAATISDPFNTSLRTYMCPPPPPNTPPPPIPNNCSWMDFVWVVPTDPLAQSQSTWSFTGVKVGDVNCTAITTGLEEPPPSEENFESETGSPIAIGQGVFKKIQVIANASQEVVAWQFGATFPSSDLHINSFLTGNTATTFDPENLYFINGSGSELGISQLNALWFSLDGSDIEINNKVLFEFTMQADAPIAALENLLELNSPTTPFKFYNALGEEIEVNLKLKAFNMLELKGNTTEERFGKDLQMRNISAIPNPFGEFIDFSFELTEEAAVEIQILDFAGKLVAKKTEQMARGQQEVRISGLENQPAGIYTYSIASEGRIIRGKLLKK